MRLLLVVLLFLSIQSYSQTHLVSTQGIGMLKLGMHQDEVEKIIGKKIPLTNPTDTISGSWQDSAKIKFKGVDFDLSFQRSYYEEQKFHMMLIGIKTKSPLCKTKEGLGVGSDKLKILSTYINHYLTSHPQYEENSDSYSKTKSIVTVRELEEKKLMRFYLVNNKVVAVESEYYWSDEE